MEITNIVTVEELQKRYNNVCAGNWLIPKMAEGMEGNTAKELIDDWPVATRSQLLSKMNLIEHEEYRFMYVDNPPKSDNKESVDNTQQLKAEICPKCKCEAHACQWHCTECEKTYAYGQYGKPGELQPVE